MTKPLTLDPNGLAHQTLRKVVQHLRLYPDHYDMSIWNANTQRELPVSPYLGCGTIACIGGTADIILKHTGSDEHIYALIVKETQSHELTEQLFYGVSNDPDNDFSWWLNQSRSFGLDIGFDIDDDLVSLFDFMTDNPSWVANVLEAWLDGKTDPILG